MARMDSLVSRVAARLSAGGRGASGREQASLLSQAAASFARRPRRAEQTIPTGFDPRAATLFESVVEAAFLVASSDGNFDQDEQRLFGLVVSEACSRDLAPADVRTLMVHLANSLAQEGLVQRVAIIATMVRSPAHRLETLRVAALMAQISNGVSRAERGVLDRLAKAFGLDAATVDGVVADAVVAVAEPAP